MMRLPICALPGAAAVVGGLFAFGVAACIAIWTTMYQRAARGEPVVPYEGRRRVPWRGRDVAVIFVIYLLPALVAVCLSWIHGNGAAAGAVEPGGKDVTHPVLVLLQSHPNDLTLLFCIFTVVAVAPIVEEVLFRLVLQGWMEKVDARCRRRWWYWAPARGFWPVAMTSVLFASLHFRTAQPQLKPEELVMLLAQVAVWNLVTLGIALAWLRVNCQATWADLGLVPKKLPADVGLGIVAFLAVAAPIYLMQGALQWLLGHVAAADPITLSCFAAVLGVLYFRTHRLVPSIALHMALNGTSLAIAWALGG